MHSMPVRAGVAQLKTYLWLVGNGRMVVMVLIIVPIPPFPTKQRQEKTTELRNLEISWQVSAGPSEASYPVILAGHLPNKDTWVYPKTP